MNRVVAFGVGLVALTASHTSFAAEDLTFKEACDGSAAIALGDGKIAVAEDENPDVIRVYDISAKSPFKPIREVLLEDHLKQMKPKKEADLEGVAEVNERLYWIGSHGRDGDGKLEVERRALFATDGELRQVGTAYGLLLDNLLEWDEKWKLGLAAAIGDVNEDAPDSLAPENDGLNIEGLGYLLTEASLLIGLRNPRGPDDKAILLPLLNVDDVVMTEQVEPRFGDPILLSLDKLGIRDLAWSKELGERGAMLVLAGKKDNEKDFRLYRWSGERTDEAKELGLPAPGITDLNPEAVVVIDRQHVLILSDDGDEPIPSTEEDCKEGFKDGKCPCKRIKEQARADKQFRGRIVEIE